MTNFRDNKENDNIWSASNDNGYNRLTITNSSFTQNNNWGCIYASSGNSTMITSITKCIFSDNGNNLSNHSPISLSSYGSGSTTATINNTIIANNKVRGGKAIYLSAVNSASISLQSTNTTIYKNSSLWPDHDSGLYAMGRDSSQFTINFTNSIIYHNNAKDLVFNMLDSAALNFTSDHSILGDKHIIGNVQYTSTNEVHGDPLLDSRYHLKEGSPAINTGICGEYVPTPTFHYERIAPYDDIDGDKRPGFGAYLGCDIGADEYKAFPWPMFLPAMIKQATH